MSDPTKPDVGPNPERKQRARYQNRLPTIRWHDETRNCSAGYRIGPQTARDCILAVERPSGFWHLCGPGMPGDPRYRCEKIHGTLYVEVLALSIDMLNNPIRKAEEIVR